MPQDTAFSAYFDQPAVSTASPLTARVPVLRSLFGVAETRRPVKSGASLQAAGRPRNATPRTTSNEDLVDLAALLEPDGGMPGDSLEMRAARTIATVLAFVAEGHTLTAGAFRLHVTRLVGFLKSLSIASDREARLIDAALEAASTGKAPGSQWLHFARHSVTRWVHIEVNLKS
jgi:hypothetical protein